MLAEKVGHYETKKFISAAVPERFSSPPSIKFRDDSAVLLIARGYSPGRIDSLYEKKVTAAQLLYPYLINGAADSDATRNYYHLMPLYEEKEGGVMMGPDEVFKRLQILLGPRPRHDSEFLTDETEVSQRMDMFNYLRPVFNALLSNPDLKNWNIPPSEKEIKIHQTGKPLDLAVAEMLRDMIEFEFFPYGQRAAEIPVVDIEKRFSLAQQLIEIQSWLAETSLEASPQSLELAALNTFLILDYPVFKEHPETVTELLKQAVPVLTKILGNPQFQEESWILDEFQTMMDPKALRYNHWQLDGEKRFTIAQLVLEGLKKTLSTREFETGTVVKILETIEVLNFAQEFSDDQKRQLLGLSLPLLNQIAESDAGKSDDVIAKLYNLIDFTLDNQGIETFKAIAEGLREESTKAVSEAVHKAVAGEEDPETLFINTLREAGFGSLQQSLDFAYEIIRISKNDPSLAEIPRLVLRMKPGNKKRGEFLNQISQLIANLEKQSPQNQIVSQLIPITEFLYRWYSNQTLTEHPASKK